MSEECLKMHLAAKNQKSTGTFHHQNTVIRSTQRFAFPTVEDDKIRAHSDLWKLTCTP